MLKALTGDQRFILAASASRGEAYRCPACNETVPLKHGAIVVPHFAHQPSSTCVLSEGESARHRAMKAAMGTIFRIPPEHYEVVLLAGQRRADLLLLPYKIVIECQASALSIKEWAARTQAYNARGYRVLWVWDAKVVGLPAQATALGYGEYRISATFRYAHQQSFGYAYVLFGDQLHGVHLAKVLHRRTSAYADDHGLSTAYWPKTLRSAIVKSLAYSPSTYRLLEKLATNPSAHTVATDAMRSLERSVPALQSFRGPDGLWLVNCSEGVWWK